MQNSELISPQVIIAPGLVLGVQEPDGMEAIADIKRFRDDIVATVA